MNNEINWSVVPVTVNDEEEEKMIKFFDLKFWNNTPIIKVYEATV